MNRHQTHRWLAVGGLLLLGSAATSAASHTVAVVSLADDPRYEARQLEKRYPGHPGGRLLDAAKVAVEEAKVELDMAGQQLKVREATAANAQELPKLLQQLKNDKVGYWVLDLPAEHLSAVQQQAAGALLFNASASRDDVRHCNNPMLHTYPSQAMLNDALAQYLASRSWRKVLLVHSANDGTLVQAWQRAAKRYGLQLVESKTFKLSGDPRERDWANPRLLTNGRDHDVVAVADSQGEFARTLPYATQQPRLVVGSNGLVPVAWHPQWERYGGPQLNRRFMRQTQRPMTGQDWAAWMAVKSISTALTEQSKASPTEHGKALRRGDITLDGFKGQPLSFRAWDGQLRQPILLSHVDGVVGVAPVDGVLHPTEVLDTLGMEEKESPCKAKP